MIGDHITTSLRATSDLSRVLARLEAHAYESRTPVAKKDAGRKGTR